MKRRIPHYYKDFKCIAGACSDSCCAGWEVDLDDKSFEYYEGVEGEFGQRLRGEMSTEGEKHFVIKNLRCPFLNQQNLCDIYTALGEEALCETCTNFPRCYEEYGSVKEMALSMACPEVVRLMLESKEHISFYMDEDNTTISGYNDISGELYLSLLGARKATFELLASDQYTLKEKLYLLLTMGDEIDKHMEKENCAKIEKAVAVLSDEEKCAKVIDKVKKNISKSTIDNYDILATYLEIIKNCEHISEKWVKMLDNLEEYFDEVVDNLDQFDKVMKDRSYEYEYFLENLTYRYMLRGVFDYYFADKTRFLGFMYTFLRALALAHLMDKGEFTLEDQQYIMQTLSKEIEHSDENMALLWELCAKGEGAFTTEAIMQLV